MAWLPDLTFEEFEAEKVRLRFNEDIVACIANYLRKKKGVPDPHLTGIVGKIVLGSLNPTSFEDMQQPHPSKRTHERRALAERYNLRMPDGAQGRIRNLADELARLQLDRNPDTRGPSGKPLRRKQLSRHIAVHMSEVLRAEMCEFRTYVI
jgi:hypothetical protein